MGCTEEMLYGLSDVDEGAREQVGTMIHQAQKLCPTRVLATVTGTLDLLRFSEALSERYGKFRSFKFGLPDSSAVYTELELALLPSYYVSL